MAFIPGSISSDSSALPLQRIVESLMRGNAENQAQAQVKEIAGKQANAAAKLQVTMTADPNEPGNPFVHIKNAKADQINQTQDQDLQNAYDAPRKNVESAIARMPSGAGEFERNALRSVGYAPEPTDKTASDLSTFNQDYRAQRDLGEGVISAALKAGVMRTGLWNKDKIAEDLDRQAAVKNAAAFRVAAEPIIQEQDRQARLNRSELQLSQTVAHQAQLEANEQRRLADQEQKTVNARHQAINKGIDYSQIDPGPNNANWHQAFDDQNDTGVAATPQQYAAIDRKGAQDVQRLYNDFFIAKKDVYQLGHFATFDQAVSAYGHQFPNKQERDRAQNAWAAAHQYDQEQSQKRELLNQATEARIEAARVKLTNEGTSKFDDSMVKILPASEIIAADPAKIKNTDQALQRKEALLRQELQTHQDAMKKQQPLMANLKGLTAPTEQDQLKLIGLTSDFNATLGKAQRVQADLGAIQAARAARRGKPVTAAPPPKAAPAPVPSSGRLLSKAEALAKMNQ